MFKILSLWGIGALLLLQAIRIEIPTPPSTIDPNHEIQAPKEIIGMLKTSCYDCHSYQTKMPWYGNVAPISWEVRSHIKEGREWLNFQEWNTYSEEKKQKIFKGILKRLITVCQCRCICPCMMKQNCHKLNATALNSGPKPI